MISWLATFTGRLHPLLVHLPIGILFMAFAFECLAVVPRYRKVRWAIQPTLFLGAVFSILAAISGLFLSEEGGYDDMLLSRHMALGIATTTCCVLIFFLRQSQQIRNKPRRTQNLIRVAMSSFLILLLSLTGHFGGSMTHGEDFLSFGLESESTTNALANVSYDAEAIYYAQAIQPILESKCYSCHSSKKQKGQLRLDAVDFIHKGGKNGKVISGTIADSSSLYARLMLPPDHDEHMPPNEKPQLSSTEISLIQVWLEEGARFDKQVKQFAQRDKIKQYIHMLHSSSLGNTLLPIEDTQLADQNTIEALRKQNVIVLPVASESNYLSVSFINAKSITDDQIQLIVKLKQQVIQLMLPYTATHDRHLEIISKLDKLRWLDLRHTLITDKSAESIKQLKELRILNVINTNLTDEGLKGINDLKNLETVFLYETKVTSKGVAWLKSQLPKMQIDTGGYQLPSLSSDTIVAKRKISL